MVVSEPDSAQGGERVVSHDNGVFTIVLVILLTALFLDSELSAGVDEPKVHQKARILVLGVILERELAVDPPNHADQIARDQDDTDESEGLEEVADVQDQSDLVVVEVHAVRQVWLVLDDVLQPVLEDAFHDLHEALVAQHVCALEDAPDLEEAAHVSLRCQKLKRQDGEQVD